VDDAEPAGLEFPCRFPVKVMGPAREDFESIVLDIVRRHAGEIPADRVKRRQSRKGRYLSVTVEIDATSREQLDDLYRALSSSPHVKVVL